MLKEISDQTVVGLTVAIILAGFGLLSTPFQNYVVSAVSGTFTWLTGTSPVSRWWFWTTIVTSVVPLLFFAGAAIEIEHVLRTKTWKSEAPSEKS